jgi:hypothetical protein
MGCWTMYPLLKKDQLILPYFAWQIIFACCMLILRILRRGTFNLAPISTPDRFTVVFFQRVSLTTLKTIFYSLSGTGNDDQLTTQFSFFIFSKLVLYFFLSIGMIVLHLLEIFSPPPARLPDLYPALFAVYGAVNFLVAYLYGVVWLWNLSEDGRRESDQVTHGRDGGNEAKKVK